MFRRARGRRAPARRLVMHRVRPALGDTPTARKEREKARQRILAEGFDLGRFGESHQAAPASMRARLRLEPRGLFTTAIGPSFVPIPGDPVVYLDITGAKLYPAGSAVGWRERLSRQAEGRTGADLAARIRALGWDGVEFEGSDEVILLAPNVWRREPTLEAMRAPEQCPPQPFGQVPWPEARTWLDYGVLRSNVLPRDPASWQWFMGCVEVAQLPQARPWSPERAHGYAASMRGMCIHCLPPVVLEETWVGDWTEDPRPRVQVADGEHRIYAATRAGLVAIPALVARRPGAEPILALREC